MGWYEAIKDGISIAQKADNIDLTRALLDAQKEMQDLQQENLELKKELGELKETQSKQVEYNEKRTAVYEIKEDGNREGPYCCTCWEDGKKLISVYNAERGRAVYQICPKCGAEISIKTPPPYRLDSSKNPVI